MNFKKLNTATVHIAAITRFIYTTSDHRKTNELIIPSADRKRSGSGTKPDKSGWSGPVHRALLMSPTIYRRACMAKQLYASEKGYGIIILMIISGLVQHRSRCFVAETDGSPSGGHGEEAACGILVPRYLSVPFPT